MTDLPLTSPDIDALADKVRRAWVQAPLFSGLCVQKLFKSYVNEAEPALDDLVAIAKDAAERAERAERERDAVHVRLCEERGRVAAPQPEAVRNWHTDGEYHARYERTRRAALASHDTKEGT